MNSVKDLNAQKDYAKEIRRENRRKFFRTMFSRKLVIFGAIGFTFFLLIAIFAPLITKYDPSSMDIHAILSGQVCGRYPGHEVTWLQHTEKTHQDRA